MTYRRVIKGLLFVILFAAYGVLMYAIFSVICVLLWLP